MSGPHSEFERDYERWTQLVDRLASEPIDPDCGVLSAEEQEFCRSFEQRHHPLCTQELAAYAGLEDLGGVPNDASRALVDRALAQLARLEAEEAERSVADVQLLHRTRMPRWVALAGAAAIAVLASFGLRSARPFQSERAGHAAASAKTEKSPSQPQQSQTAPLARAELVYASGSVSVSGKFGSAGRALLGEDSTIETADGTACILIDADINICLAAQSRMRLSALATPARRIELESGELATRLATQPEGMSLTISAAGVDSTAIGTAFSVERRVEHGNIGITDVSVVTTVLNGRVRVARQDGEGDTRYVNAHERSLTSVEGPSVKSVSRSDEAPSWALLGPTVLWHDPVSATLEVRGEPAGAEVWLDDQRVGVTPLSSLVPVGAHRVIVNKEGRELTSRALHAHAGEAVDVSYGPQPAAAARPEAAERPTRVRRPTRRSQQTSQTSQPARRETVRPLTAASPALTPDELLREARQTVRAGRYAEAATEYEKLIGEHTGSEQAQTALLLLGQLRLSQLGDARGALEVLNAYLRNPGSLEVEALVARIDALHALQRSADEASAIEDFLRRHPHSFEAAALSRRRAALRGSP